MRVVCCVLMVGERPVRCRLRHSIQRSAAELKCGRSACERCQRSRQHVNAASNRLRRGVFVRPVTHAAAAGNEQHRHRRNARHEERVVVRAAHHLPVRASRFSPRTPPASARIAARRSQADRHSPLPSMIVTPRLRDHLVHAALKRIQHASRRPSSVSRMSVSSRTRGWECCSPRRDKSGTCRRCRRCRWRRSRAPFFDREHDLRAAAKSVLRSGISTPPAWPPSPSIRMRTRAGAAMLVTMPKGRCLLLQQRTLLDMQFDEGGIVALRQSAPGQANPGSRLRRAVAPGCCPRHLSDACLRRCVRAAAHHPAAQAAEAEARRFLRGKEHQLDRSLAAESQLLQ